MKIEPFLVRAMSTLNGSFWDVFGWENRDRRLDDFPMMQSPIGPIGEL